MEQWIHRLLADPEMVRMGHGQRAEDANLGLGWIYYALARALRPARAVVIGSWRGFVPIVLGRAMAENVEGGEVVFIDPSLVDDFWKDPAAVAAHFREKGVTNVTHHRATTQEFVGTDAYRALGEIGLLFVDGLHTREQARYDYEAFRDKLAPGAIALFHDSVRARTSRIYGADKPYVHSVVEFIDELRTDARLQVLDLPLADGLTMVRRRDLP